MSVDAKSYLKHFNGASQSTVLSGLNFPTLGMSARGTISAGNLICEVSVDGYTWQAIAIYTGTTPLSGGLIIAAGSYRSSIAGYSEVRVSTSSDFSGNIILNSVTSPAFFLEGVVGDITNVTATLPLLSSGGTAPVISVSGISGLGTALQGMFMNSGATAMEWVSSTGTGSIARATLPAFAGITNSSTMLTTGFAGFGISTTTPTLSTSLVEIESDGSTSVTAISHGAAATSGFVGFSTGGTKASPSATPDATILNSLRGLGYTNAYTTVSSARITFVADGLWANGTNQGAFLTFFGTSNASTTAAEWARLYRGNLLIGSTTDNGARLQVTGSSIITGFSGFGISTNTSAITSSLSEWETDGNTGTRNAMICHGSSSSNIFWSRNTGGTKASPSATPANANFISVEAVGYTTSLLTGSNGIWAMMADGLWSGSNAGVVHTWSGTPNGSTTRAEWMRLYRGNLVIGTTASGATANKTLALSNSATSPSASVDLCHLYCLDISAGNAAFACFQEAVVSSGVAVASTNKWPVIINGTTYYVLMTTVP